MKKIQNFPMLKWAKELFPLCRSLTGEGTKKTLRYFKLINKEFKIITFNSGKKVFDWTIPLEWNIKDAFIQHIKSGKKFAEFKKNNLHIVGYSIPVKKILSKKKLIKNIYTQKGQKNSIPYVTSYYKKNWGFCLSENDLKKLPNGDYKVFIDSVLRKGTMELMHANFKGKSNKEIFFSSYICHPSMANNELSGPVLLNAIMLYLKSNYKKTKYSYRFVLLPETIGSIAYISKYKRILKKNIIAGYNLTCVGDERNYTIINTPSGQTLADKALESALFGKKNLKKYSYLLRGSDERQYCSPGVDLPVCCFSRSHDKDFPEYHTDKDNFKLVTQKGLSDSFDVIKDLIDAFELGIYPKTLITCEPNLGKRNLYPTLSRKGAYDKAVYNRTHLIAYSNGKNNIFDISIKLKIKLRTLLTEYKLLKKNKILN